MCDQNGTSLLDVVEDGLENATCIATDSIAKSTYTPNRQYGYSPRTSVRSFAGALWRMARPLVSSINPLTDGV